MGVDLVATIQRGRCLLWFLVFERVRLSEGRRVEERERGRNLGWIRLF